MYSQATAVPTVSRTVLPPAPSLTPRQHGHVAHHKQAASHAARCLCSHRYRAEVLQHSTHDDDREAVAAVSAVGGNSFHAFLSTAIASLQRELQHQQALEAAEAAAAAAGGASGAADRDTESGRGGVAGGGRQGGSSRSLDSNKTKARRLKSLELKRRLDQISSNFRLGQQHLVGLHSYDIHSNSRYRIAFGMEQPLAQHLHRGFYWEERGNMFERVGVQVRRCAHPPFRCTVQYRTCRLKHCCAVLILHTVTLRPQVSRVPKQPHRWHLGKYRPTSRHVARLVQSPVASAGPDDDAGGGTRDHDDDSADSVYHEAAAAPHASKHTTVISKVYVSRLSWPCMRPVPTSRASTSCCCVGG